MDISFNPSIPPYHPLPLLTTSLSITIPPSVSPKSSQHRVTKMRRTLSESPSASSPATSASESFAFEDAHSLLSVHADSIPTSAETSTRSQYTSAHAHWSVERTEGADEDDDYAWYFRNPHRYIWRPRPSSLRHKRNSSNIVTGADGQRYSRNGDGDGGEVNMLLFAAYLERHYAATPLSATFNYESAPTRACAAGAQAAVGMIEDGSRIEDCDRARNLRADRRMGASEEKTHSDDGASTVFSTSTDDWDAPTLTNGSLRSSKLSCDMQHSSYDTSSGVIPCSPVSPGSSYVEVSAAFQGLPSSWDFGSPSKLIGASYMEVGITDCRDGGAPGSCYSGHRGQDGAKDDMRSSSFLQPISNSNHRKFRGVSPAQRFSFLRIFS